MNPIELPAYMVKIATSAGANAGPEQIVVIEQDRQAATITICTLGRITRLSAPSAAGYGQAGPLAIRTADLGQAMAAAPAEAAGRPLVVMQLSPQLAALVPALGSPSTVAIVQATLTDTTGVIDAAEGEAASGMTRSVAVVPPDYLRQVAEAAEGIGCTAVEIVFAARFGSVLSVAETPGCTAAIVIAIAGHNLFNRPAPEAAPASKPLVFNVPGPGARGSSRPAKPEPLPLEEDLPF